MQSKVNAAADLEMLPGIQEELVIYDAFVDRWTCKQGDAGRLGICEAGVRIKGSTTGVRINGSRCHLNPVLIVSSMEASTTHFQWHWQRDDLAGRWACLQHGYLLAACCSSKQAARQRAGRTQHSVASEAMMS